MLFEKQVLNTFRNGFIVRCDDAGTAHYFSAEDFPGLQSESFAFPSSVGHTLQGWFYHYENPIPGRIVVFDHGFGGGHRSYMKEIELLCRHGFLVFAYDHTGCMLSGGENIRGFSQSLRDLDDCLKALKATDRCKNLDISVMGHSWGGFSTLNICALHPEISHVVVLSGFVSVENLVNQFFGGLMKGYRKAVLALEQESNPRFSQFNAVQSLSKSTAKALLIYSDDDQLCRRAHYDILKEGLDGKENVRFLLVSNKGHNPNYTEDAVKLLAEFSKARTKFAKKKNATQEEKAHFVESFDWDQMTVQDEAVWNEIFAHLDAN
jgi:dipeptidyl aminopeptidase/acylaminoacyl peptidase